MSTLCLLMATDNKYLHADITIVILQAFYTVHNNVTFGLTRDKITDNRQDMDSKNQLRLTDHAVCLILNFAFEGEHKRLFFTNDIKKRK